jgi:SpoIID/LytB domain protein
MRATVSGTPSVERGRSTDRSGRRWLRRPFAVASALAVAVSGLVALAPSASAEVIVRPSDGVLRVKGHGWGHGRGMSQWGAYGAATKGLTYTKILDFYYPGTDLGTLPDSSITVRITGDDDGITQVQSVSGLRVSSGSNRTAKTLPTDLGATSWRTSTSMDGATATLQYHAKVDGTWTWQNYDLLGNGGTLAAPVTFSSSTGKVRVLLGSTYREYAGSVSGVRYSGTHYSVVRTTMESYLRGVVPSEMPSYWKTEALKAQAVAARTYAANQRASSPSGRPYQTCDSTSCQVFKGLAEYTTGGELDATHTAPPTDAAITATAEKILTYGGKPAFTEFSASNGGYSVQGYFGNGSKVPYLVAKADPYDGVVPNAAHDWTDSVTVAVLEQKHPSIGTLRSITVDRDGHGDWGGRPDDVTLTGSTGSVRLSGSTFSSEAGFKHRWWALATPQEVPPAPRLAGDDRYETAAAIAAKFGTNVSVAYVASSSSFADALAGAARAGSDDGPVLLTKGTSLPSATAAALTKLKPARIFVLGQTGAVSDKVKETLARYATTGVVTRLGGADRYATAAQVAALYPAGLDTVYVASGEAFPDALAGAAAAAAGNAPVLLTKGASLPSDTVSALSRLQPRRIVVVGGEGAVTPAVVDQLKPYAHGGGVVRVSGDDRYETASAVATTLLPDATSAYVANGLQFPDALAGAALAGHLGAPVLLTKPTSLPGATASALQKQLPSAITVLGGSGVVSSAVASELGRYIVP